MTRSVRLRVSGALRSASGIVSPPHRDRRALSRKNIARPPGTGPLISSRPLRSSRRAFSSSFLEAFSPGIPGGAFRSCRFVYVIGVLLFIHTNLALLPMNRPALHAMFRNGFLPVDFVKSHHPIWYERLNGDK